MLTSSELAELQQFTDAGDRISYYERLEELGSVYDGLALSVVLHYTLAGQTTNESFQIRAGVQRGQPSPSP